MPLLLVLGLAACASTPMVYPVAQRAAARPASSSTELYVYPRAGQGDEQTRRDRYACHRQAVRASNLDPSRLPAEAAVQRRWVASPSAQAPHDTVALAATGALIGSAAGSPGARTEAALLGMVLGGVLGAVSDSQRANAVQQTVAAHNQSEAARDARVAERIEAYREHSIACLEARQYSAR